MHVAAGNHNRQAGNAAQRLMDFARVRAAACAALQLYGDIVLLRRIKRKIEHLPVRDDAPVHKRKRRAFAADGHLLVAVGHAHVVGGGGIDDDGAVGLYLSRGHHRAAQGDLLLHGKHAGDIARIIALLKHVEQNHAAGAVVERLCLDKAVAELHVFAFKRGIAARRAEALRLRLILRADVDADHLIIRRLFPVRLAHQVNRLHADDARHSLFAHDNAL